MEYSIIQVALVFIVTFVAAIDQFNFLESLYQPIVTGAVIGLILGDLNTGLLVGGTYQLMTIGNMPIGGAQPPNAVIGGIMASHSRYRYGPRAQRGSRPCHSVRSAWSARRYPGLHAYVAAHVLRGQHGSQR